MLVDSDTQNILVSNKMNSQEISLISLKLLYFNVNFVPKIFDDMRHINGIICIKVTHGIITLSKKCQSLHYKIIENIKENTCFYKSFLNLH